MRILLAGGGTGGHLFPLIAVAEALRRKDPQIALLLCGRRNSLEQQEADRAKIRFLPLFRQSNRRDNALQMAISLLLAALGVCQCLYRLFRLRPDWVVGSGGYISLPMIAAAKLLGQPYVLLEQNRIPGKVTRSFARSAQAVFLTFPAPAGSLVSQRTILVGNPVRQNLFVARSEAREFLGLAPSALLLVLAGGSQGARSLNEFAVSGLPRLLERIPQLEVFWVAGSKHASVYRERLPLHERLQLVDFTTEAPIWVAAADLFVGRSSAGFLSEALVAGVPSILVPYPHAADDHQMANARFLEEAGAAIVVTENALATLEATIVVLFQNPQRLEEMRRATAALARPRAASEVAGWLLGRARATR
ncbi:MAG: UDP-N-acetylglucosamine--N-acetylmuramyl-(pentapeptide) pyrophosphoryl-undecaprenol N-acetylglucosamine transferase [bacterium]